MRRVERIGAGLAGVAGLVVLVGWYTGVASLTALPPGYGAMKPNTALAFVALAIAVILLDRSRFALPLGAAVAALGSVTLLESALGRAFGVDVLLPGVGLDRAAGRMAPATATALVLLGAARLSLVGSVAHSPCAAWRWRHWWSQRSRCWAMRTARQRCTA